MANSALINLLAALQGPAPVPGPAQPMPLGPIGMNNPALMPGPNLDAMPEQAPVAPLPPIDTNLINQLSGTAPTPPRPPSTLQRIANMLMGFSAGIEGRGPQFLESLREPQRQYEAATERYQNRRADAIELAERKRERAQEITQRRADEVARRDFDLFVQRSGVQDRLRFSVWNKHSRWSAKP